VGKMNSRPALASCPVASRSSGIASGVPPPPNFVSAFGRCAVNDVALAPTYPCAGDDKELPKTLLLEFIKFVIITI